MEAPFSINQAKLTSMKEQFVPHFKFLAAEVKSDVQRVIRAMINENPSRQVLQKLSRSRLLEEAPILRSHLWKLLLQTLPLNHQLWEQTKKSNFQLYKSLSDKFLGTYLDEEDLIGFGGVEKPICWDETLWAQIQLDTKRTHSSLNFFQKQINHTKLYLNRPTKNHDIMSRILYIWGRINPTVKYVQGMNEILAPLYYLEFQSFDKFSESETFFMFASVMSFVIDMHIKEMDESSEGIMGKMRSFNEFLKVVDYPLWNKLNSEGVLPQYYCFRWLALLLAQQFGLCQTMTIWDVFFSYDGYKRYFYLFCSCASILKLRKKEILQGDFISILPAIQKLKNMDIHQVLKVALKLYDKYCKVNIQEISKRIDEDKKSDSFKQKQSNNQQQNVKNTTSSQQYVNSQWNARQLMKDTANYLYKWIPSAVKK